MHVSLWHNMITFVQCMVTTRHYRIIFICYLIFILIAHDLPTLPWLSPGRAWSTYLLLWSLGLLCVLSMCEVCLYQRLKATLSPLMHVEHKDQAEHQETDEDSSQGGAQHEHVGSAVWFWKNTIYKYTVYIFVRQVNVSKISVHLVDKWLC